MGGSETVSTPSAQALDVFDISLAVAALPACGYREVSRFCGDQSTSLYARIYEVGLTALRRAQKSKRLGYISFWHREKFIRAAGQLNAALQTLDEWLDSDEHRQFDEVIMTYGEESNYGVGDEEEDALVLARIDRAYREQTPYCDIAPCSEEIGRLLGKATEPFVPYRQAGMNIGNLWAIFLEGEQGGRTSDRPYLCHRVQAALRPLPEEDYGTAVQWICPEAKHAVKPDTFWSGVTIVRHHIYRGLKLSEAEVPKTSVAQQKTRKGETPSWLVLGLVLLKDTNGQLSDAEYARRLGVNRSTLSRSEEWRKAKRKFTEARPSSSGERLRSDARKAKTSARNLLRNELHNDDA